MFYMTEPGSVSIFRAFPWSEIPDFASWSSIQALKQRLYGKVLNYRHFYEPNAQAQVGSGASITALPGKINLF